MSTSAKKKPKEFKPGSFIYHGGMVFEIDSQGKKHPRKDLGLNSGTFKHKYFKP
jgi:hypothetical protein